AVPPQIKPDDGGVETLGRMAPPRTNCEASGRGGVGAVPPQIKPDNVGVESVGRMAPPETTVTRAAVGVWGQYPQLRAVPPQMESDRRRRGRDGRVDGPARDNCEARGRWGVGAVPPQIKPDNVGVEAVGRMAPPATTVTR